MNLRDFLAGLLGSSIIAVINGLRILRLSDYYRSEGLLRSEILWSTGMFVFYIVLWMDSAAAGRWLKAKFTNKPTEK